MMIELICKRADQQLSFFGKCLHSK